MNITRKDLYKVAKIVVQVGAWGVQHLVRNAQKIGYNIGIYGHNWDAYNIGGGVVVCTGFRNLTGQNVNALARKYDEKAREILQKALPYQEREQQVEQLLKSFTAEILASLK